MKRLLLNVLIIFGLISTAAYAETDIMKAMVNAREKIQGLDDTLAQVKKDTGVSPVFPAFIPKTTMTYFASSDMTSKVNGMSYVINIDSTAKCHGVKYCNIGSVTAQHNGKPEMMTDRNKKVITTEVMLADGTNAYYTPSHAMADMFPASIQWNDQNVLYTINWKTESKDALITMANSAKHPGAG